MEQNVTLHKAECATQRRMRNQSRYLDETAFALNDVGNREMRNKYFRYLIKVVNYTIQPWHQKTRLVGVRHLSLAN